MITVSESALINSNMNFSAQSASIQSQTVTSHGVDMSIARIVLKRLSVDTTDVLSATRT
jgi:ribosomal protein S25